MRTMIPSARRSKRGLMMRLPAVVFLALSALIVLGPSLEARPSNYFRWFFFKPDPRKDPRVQKILADLKPAYPQLTAGDVVGTSNHDLRAMYVHLFHTQGMKLHAAKLKAATVPLKEN